ncbi:host-nuclease inhibitor Gam family protein [Neobacillus sp. WH10]|uniref:host-nuclease inhibitor Gam family protein n=1 Tax=Neobacillus sp. WH10 TaxID=3047873 RepID=UPI0024C101F6|nr:host-nuclease inhibitor Gam family protein [Neobacillus sp. WH10]WHY76102.1 host-nuclease inhibitor Gam family protein [Neobacillus sp. WH10]
MVPLENVLVELEEQEVQELQNVFAVVDLETAAEAQRRIVYFEDRKTEIDSIIEKQIAPFLLKIEKIKEWGEQAKIEFNEKQVHYSNHLEHYLRQEVAKQLETGKKPKKTIALPYGKISLKSQQPKFEKDESELFQYAKENGFIRVKEETNWAELKKKCVVADGKLYDTNGEQVPGVVVVEQPEKFELKME